MHRTSDGLLTAGKIPGFAATRPPPPLDRHSALFLDIDGTLLEIASRPERVHVPSGLPPLLRDLAWQRDGALALVSGRALDEIDRLLRPWQGAAAGLHGIERRAADGTVDSTIDPAAAAALDRLRPHLKALAGAGSGVTLEDKGKTLALHYRAAPQREPEIRLLTEEMARREEALRLMAGKMVVEFQPRGINKGEAIAAFLAEPPFIGRLAVFIGDDVTDEDGFTEISARNGIAVRVGPRAQTRARYALPDVRAVHAWLTGT